MKTNLLSRVIALMATPAFLQAETMERGAYLQNGCATAITVRWRTTNPTTSVVRYGQRFGSLSQSTGIPGKRTDHEVRLTGLAPDTRYFYSVGTADGPLAGNRGHYFVTAPVIARPTRFWVLGDAGTGNEDQRQVRDAYYKFTGSKHTDFWLMLGDNVYSSGTDSKYAENLFAVYPTMLRKSVLWTTLGNHDAAGSDSRNQTGPYFDIFTYPIHGYAGGVPSDTEAFYSFDYGNIHVVCLDSAESSLSATGPMARWLTRDLAANIKDWTIVFFHHSPYTKGSHNSDSEHQLVEMRGNFNPIFESHGVDLVLSSHSHTYERSRFIDGHYGKSETFNAKTMVKQSGGGKGARAYTKTAMGPVPHEGTIYAVCGTGGETSGGGLDHPAMWISMKSLGSMVLDIDGNVLTSTYIDNTGARLDTFSIIKGDSSHPKPVVKITRPADGKTFVAPADIPIHADATETGGTITKVEFFRGPLLLKSDTSSPYRFVHKNVPAGIWNLTAVATDDRGVTTTSPVVTVRVKKSIPIPLDEE